MSFPVIGEIWTNLEGILQANAKRLVEDIAKKQGVEPKELWDKVKPMTRIGILDIEFDEPPPVYCSYPFAMQDGAVKQRCRAPCVIGFAFCAEHSMKPLPQIQNQSTSSSPITPVKRIFDMNQKSYFVDEKGIARDKNGKPKGYVKDEVLYIFQKNESNPNNSLSNKSSTRESSSSSNTI